MAMGTSSSWKNRLQEYCQKNKLQYPNYRLERQSDASSRITFQAEVEVDGYWYPGETNCTSKKDAEQSAAEQAYRYLCKDVLESRVEAVNDNVDEHMPEEYKHIERFLSNRASASGGWIRKVRPPDRRGWYRIEIGGHYRFCENIKTHHKRNQVYFLVDPVQNVYYQRCYDPDCQGFQSAKLPLPPKESGITFNVTECSEPPPSS